MKRKVFLRGRCKWEKEEVQKKCWIMKGAMKDELEQAGQKKWKRVLMREWKEEEWS